MSKFKVGARVIFFNRAKTDSWSGEIVYEQKKSPIPRANGIKLYRIFSDGESYWIRENRIELDKGYYRNQKIARIL